MPRFGPQLRDRPVLAIGETKFHGDPVAAVAAETLDAAEEAARLVRVDVEELPAVHTVAAARAPDAPLVQDPSLRPNDPLAGTNVLREHRYGWGDLEAAEREADVVVEGAYTFPMVTQFAIEPHAFMAAPNGDGIVVWSAIQHPNWLQRVIADLVRLPLSKVRIIAPDPGGGFGGKQHAKYEPLVAFMALRLGRPVRLVLTLEETFQAVRRGAAEIRVRSGFKRDGTLVFRDIDADYLIGAYADIADRTVAKGSYTSGGPYCCPAVRIVARSVLSHTVPSTAFRGFGNPQQIWATESNMDDAARAARHRPAGAAPAQPRPDRRPVHPRGHAGRRGVARGASPGRRADRLGRSRAGRPRPRHRRGPEGGPDDGALVFDRPPAGRRQRRRVRRHLGHGPGRADDLRPDRGR